MDEARAGRRTWVAAGLLLLGLVACVKPRTVEFEHLEEIARQPTSDPDAGVVPETRGVPDAGEEFWSRLDNIAKTFDRQRVVYPKEPKFEPIAPAITALSYLGPDMGQKFLDQQVCPGPDTQPQDGSTDARCGWTVDGGTLADVCGQSPALPTPLPSDTSAFGNPTEPFFVPAWVAVPRRPPGPAGAQVECDGQGKVTGSHPADFFCLHARVALQPGDGPAPLVMVVHGLFDSANHHYIRNTGSILHAMKMSVALLDMRDHGETYRRNPDVPTTLGKFEGDDLLHVARRFRADCARRVGRVGIVGYSGGGLMAIRAYTADKRAARGPTPTLDLGVLTVSPVLDTRHTVEAMSSTGKCAATTALEFDWQLDATVGLVAGALTGLLVHDLAERPGNSRVPLSIGVGAGAGVLAMLVADRLLDGDSRLGGLGPVSSHCVARRGIADMFIQLLQERWRSLAKVEELPPYTPDCSPADYLALRYHKRYGGVPSPQCTDRVEPDIHVTPEELVRDLRASEPPGWKGHLAVLTSPDDVVVGDRPAKRMERLLGREHPERLLTLAGSSHTAFAVVNHTLNRKLLESFFCQPATRCPEVKEEAPGARQEPSGALP